jgi:hypothetical protein
MRIRNKKLFIDLKYFSSGCHSLALNCEEMVDEFWKNETEFHSIIIQLDGKGITIEKFLRPEILSAFRFYRH